MNRKKTKSSIMYEKIVEVEVGVEVVVEVVVEGHEIK